MLVPGLLVLQTAGVLALILVGSLVEGYGYGLSLGTRWPYHREILALAVKGDPEAWHRLIATALGANAVLLALLLGGTNTISGLILIAATALLGLATLHVLAGQAPPFLHGLHGLLAYSTVLCYLAELQASRPSVWHLAATLAPLHLLLLMVFLGGMVTGARGHQTEIGGFVAPRSAGQWVFVAHGLAWLLLVLTLAYDVQRYNVALILALTQAIVGFMLYQAVNTWPARPGILVVFHQGIAVLILLSVVLGWEVRVPVLG
jgi:hypothetical protein